MSVAYLLPSNRPALLAAQLPNISALCRSEDEIVTCATTCDDQVCTNPGHQREVRKRDETFCLRPNTSMAAALRDCLAVTSAEIVRIICDDDDYSMPGSIKAVELLEDSDIDVLVTGGYKSAKTWKDAAICVPAGTNYGSSPECVAWYGACGSGLFMRTEAVRKYDLLGYDGRLIDNYIVLKAIKSGANVKFARLDTYRHYMSLSDMTDAQYATYQREKKALRESFGVWGLKRRAHEAPPKWDGAFA